MMRHQHLSPTRLTRRELLAGSFASCAAGMLLAGPGRAAAQDLGSPSAAALVRNLKPGEFLWAPDVAPAGPVLLVVSLQAQRAYVYRNGVPIGISTISSGKKGHETPTGVFTILQKKVDHKSNLYQDAPMPFMQRLTWDGVALHAGNLPGYPASHGCIRLPLGFARLLYEITGLGMTVLIADNQAVPRVAPTPAFLRDDAATMTADARTEEWKPGLAPSGPLSIVISAADAQIVVLRNGVRIGSAPVQIAGAVPYPAAYTLSSMDAGSFRWVRLALPGQQAEAEQIVTVEERARLRLPVGFQEKLRAVLTPGTTAIVTPDTLASGSSGEKLTVVTASEGD